MEQQIFRFTSTANKEEGIHAKSVIQLCKTNFGLQIGKGVVARPAHVKNMQQWNSLVPARKVLPPAIKHAE